MYENFPSAMQKNRPRDRSLGTVSLGGVMGPPPPPDETGRADDHIYQNPSRLTQQSAMMRSRGASVDRYREYLTPQYYDENYYVTSREDNERRVTVKHIGMPGPGSEPGRLERQWSHPNLRPRPHPSSAAGGRDGGGSISACGRRYSKNHY